MWYSFLSSPPLLTDEQGPDKLGKLAGLSHGDLIRRRLTSQLADEAAEAGAFQAHQ